VDIYLRLTKTHKYEKGEMDTYPCPAKNLNRKYRFGILFEIHFKLSFQ